MNRSNHATPFRDGPGQLKTVEFILGYPVTTKSKQDCVSDVVGWIENGETGRFLVCANVHSLELARSDPAFSAAVHHADIVTPDGVGMVIASRLSKGKILDRITGSDIFFGLSAALNRRNSHTCFFLGSTEKTLSKIKERMTRDFPNIAVVGTYSPPFKEQFNDVDNALMFECINNVKPDVLWVGMTQPKQEKWIHRNIDGLDVSFVGAVGAVFDFYAGTVKRCHPWLQRHGLEWVHRFVEQPRSVWRRDVVSIPRFLVRLLCQHTFNYRMRPYHRR